MAAKPYMPLYVADYLSDAAHLTTLEHGAYMLMIMTYWQTGKPLPDDDKKLCEITKLNFTNYKKINSHLREFFFCENGKLIHKRIEKELDEFKKKSDMARIAGLKSAESKRLKNSTDVQRTFNGRSTNVQPREVVDVPFNHTDTDTETNTDTDKKNKEEKKEKKKEEKSNTIFPSPKARENTHNFKKQEDIKTVFEFWKKTMSHMASNLSVERRKSIGNGLTMGYTKEQLCEAIIGCSKSPWHMGENPNGEIWDGIKMIFKSADQIDKFLRYSKNPPRPLNKTEKLFEGNRAIAQSWAERKKQELKNVQ